MAASRGHAAAVLALMAAGADVKRRFGIFKKSMLRQARKRRVDIVRAPIEREADVDVIDTK